MEPSHHWLRAVMAGANGDSFLSEERADIVRVDSVEDEREHAGLFSRRPNQTQIRNAAQNLCRVGEYVGFVRRDALQAKRIHVLDRASQAERARDMRSPRFEFVRQLVVKRLLKRYRTDHVAAALIRRHGVEQGRFSVKG